VHLTVYSR